MAVAVEGDLVTLYFRSLSLFFKFRSLSDDRHCQFRRTDGSSTMITSVLPVTSATDSWDDAGMLHDGPGSAQAAVEDNFY